MIAAENKRSAWQQYYKIPSYASLAVLALIAVYCGATHQWSGILTVVLLAILEISLSFDNATVNATYVQRLDDTWRKRFLTWGIWVAVVGVRFALPVITVSISAKRNPIAVIAMMFTNPGEYITDLTHVRLTLITFGGVYLAQIFLNYMLNVEDKTRWLPLEHPFEWIAAILPVRLVVLVGACIATYVQWLHHPANRPTILIAGACAMGLFQMLSFTSDKVESKEQRDKASNTKGMVGWQTGKTAFLTLCYLEFQDMAFSFDGLLGAFAYTMLVILILAGLAIGAMFVRGMTIHFVATDTLTELRFLASGAFWAIGTLSILMLYFNVNDLVTGGISTGIILLSVACSIYRKLYPLPEKISEDEGEVNTKDGVVNALGA